MVESLVISLRDLCTSSKPQEFGQYLVICNHSPSLMVIADHCFLFFLDFIDFRKLEVNGESSICGVPSVKRGFLIQFHDLIACDLGKVT